jgi:OmpA-OmpF porin, OOP family
MKTNSITKIGGALLGAALLATTTPALSGGYIGLGIGKVDLDIPFFEDPRGWEIIGGYEFNRNFAVEVTYLDIGDASDNIPPAWIISGNTLTFGALGKLPVTPELELFVKGGLHMWDLELREEGWGKIGEADGTDIFFGFGANYMFPNGLGIGGRYMIYDMDGDDVTVLSVNLQYRF